MEIFTNAAAVCICKRWCFVLFGTLVRVSTILGKSVPCHHLCQWSCWIVHTAVCPSASTRSACMGRNKHLFHLLLRSCISVFILTFILLYISWCVCFWFQLRNTLILFMNVGILIAFWYNKVGGVTNYKICVVKKEHWAQDSWTTGLVWLPGSGPVTDCSDVASSSSRWED